MLLGPIFMGWAIIGDLFFLLYFALVWDLQFFFACSLNTVKTNRQFFYFPKFKTAFFCIFSRIFTHRILTPFLGQYAMGKPQPIEHFFIGGISWVQASFYL